MKLYEVLKTAISALKANKLRSSLTILGVIIGVFAVVTLIAFGKGMENYITDEFDKLGSNLIFVSPGSGDFTGDPAETYTNNKLANKHLKLIDQHANDFLVGIYPYNFVGENVSFKTKSYYSELVGINYDGVEGFSYLVDSGRSFNKTEEKSEAKVVVLGPNVVEELFGGSSPLGMSIKIGGERFEVIGTFASKGSNYDDGVIIPYTTLAEIFEIDNFSSIVAKVDDSSNVPLAIRQVELALLRDLRDDEFAVMSQADVLGSIQEILDIVTIALGAIAGISLLVGGIGIMNIMLVSVTERTREVGLRKALGATPSNITIQFLVESVLLSVMGGIVGLGLGAIATFSVQQFIRAEMTPSAIITAFVFSVAVGVIFGTYPAVNAGKKDPITALRYE